MSGSRPILRTLTAAQRKTISINLKLFLLSETHKKIISHHNTELCEDLTDPRRS